MNHFTNLKKSYLFSSFLLVFFFSLTFFGVLIHNYYWEYQLGAAELREQALLEKKNILREYVDSIIKSIESDVAFCGNNGHWDAGSNEIKQALCSSPLIVELARNRLSSAETNDDIVVKIIVDLGAERLANIEETDTRDTAAAIDKDDLSDISHKTELIEKIITQGELFVGGDLQAIKSGKIPETLTYFNYYNRFKWIISAEYDLNFLISQIAKSETLLKKNGIHRAITSLGPFFFFLAIALVTILIFFISIAKTLKLHEQLIKKEKDKQRESEFQLNLLTEYQAASAAKDRMLQHLFEGMSGLIVIHTSFKDNTLIVNNLSKGVTEILGYTPEESIGQPIESLLEVAGSNTNDQSSLQDQLYHLKHLRKDFKGVANLVKADGRSLPVQIWVYPILGEDEKLQGAIISAIDISTLRETERVLLNTQNRLLHAQKLEAIGTLAGGIAHDFNNVLSSIVGYSELLRDQLVKGSMARDDLEQILQATSRASNLVKQIHAFSRKKDMENSFFEPGIIIKESLKMLRSTLPSTIVIKQDIRIEGEAVYANTTRFHQLFMNLCTNAFKAMERNGGELKISLKKIDNISHVPTNFKLEGDQFVELSVSDGGCGISEDVGNSIFEPFSMNSKTDEIGGSLSDNYKMVVSAGGAIWFKNQDSGGVVFYVVLPVRHEDHQTSKDKDTNESLFGTESIMFVDDEEDLTKMAEKMLTGFGYTVHSHTNSEEALNEYLSSPEKFDLIITDQSMPGMTGSQLTQKIRETFSKVPVLLCTGYSAKITEENWKKSGINGFVIKPFRKNDIAKIVRDILDAVDETDIGSNAGELAD